MERPLASKAGTVEKTLSYTVIMHIYNEMPHLVHNFDAINRQTVKPLDVVVVDDGSTDETPDIIHRYGYTHIHLNQPKHLPKYARRANAFNRAVDLAKTVTPGVDCLLKVDGDSHIYDTYAEYTLAALEKDPLLAAVSGVSVLRIKTRDLSNGAVMYRVKTLPKARVMYGWDRDIQLRLVSKGYKFHVIKTLGYGESRIPTVTYSGYGKAAKNRTKSRIAELRGFINNFFGRNKYE